jgi:hypothetical protein
MLAQEFAQIGRMSEAFNGPDGGVIVGRRNEAAVEALQQAVAGGKQKLALFYGAAHMPDLAGRLETLGYRRTGMRYLTAWDIPAPPATQPGR